MPFPRYVLLSLRRRIRSSEAAIILVAIVTGIAAGLLTAAQSTIAHTIQSLCYGISIERLSASDMIAPVRLLTLPAAGLVLVAISRIVRRTRAAVDVVEANALHGGVIPASDTVLVCAQTLVSNGGGASVGLEAAYAQAGGGLASVMGSALRLRRNDMRVLVGAGAGAALGAAFGAPLTGAFYAFEIVIGAYTPAAIAPVAAAAVAAVLVVRGLGLQPYLQIPPSALPIYTLDYLLFAALGIICALVGIVLMRAVTFLEQAIRRSPLPDYARPVLGGLLLIPLALASPQVLSAGHGALHLDLSMQISIGFLVTILLLKISASAISLSFGFRGGLFFASLFLGSLVGQMFALFLPMLASGRVVDPTDAALIGMASMAVAVVGGPMTMSMLVLETTHDFTLTGVAITAGLCASTVVRETFGFSFSTWRLHTRGETILSPRDVGWTRALTAGRMMRRGVPAVEDTTTLAEFRRRFPLGSVSRVVLNDGHGRYVGILDTATAYAPDLPDDCLVGTLDLSSRAKVRPDADVRALMKVFDESETDDLAVVDAEDRVLGTLSERFVQRRYTDEIEKAQRELFGERA